MRALKVGGPVLAAALVGAFLLIQDYDTDRTATGTTTATETVVRQAPAGLSTEEAAGISDTLAAIDSGEPLPYDQDGSTFQNRERLLPDEPEGYYREYTVETPGSDDRGARRLVIGQQGETYYTNDHYSSFIEIEPEDFR
jgi:ribonuclease T1